MSIPSFPSMQHIIELNNKITHRKAEKQVGHSKDHQKKLVWYQMYLFTDGALQIDKEILKSILGECGRRVECGR